MRPKVSIVGVGPGGRAWVTPAARQALETADMVVSWDLNLEPVRDLVAGKRLWLQRPGDYRRVAEQAAAAAFRTGATTAVVRIGDPTVSGGLPGLLDLYRGAEVRVVPGISSVQAVAAAAGIELHRAVVFSFHDQDGRNAEERDFLLTSFRRGRHLVVLVGPAMRPGDLARLLLDHGADPATEAVVGSRLTLPEERIDRCTLREMAERTYDWLSVVVVRAA
jgi:precorrin-6y C5,15-methyltransferase (decarboxylating) CbiE subunit